MSTQERDEAIDEFVDRIPDPPQWLDQSRQVSGIPLGEWLKSRRDGVVTRWMVTAVFFVVVGIAAREYVPGFAMSGQDSKHISSDKLPQIIQTEQKVGRRRAAIKQGYEFVAPIIRAMKEAAETGDDRASKDARSFLSKLGIK